MHIGCVRMASSQIVDPAKPPWSYIPYVDGSHLTRISDELEWIESDPFR